MTQSPHSLQSPPEPRFRPQPQRGNARSRVGRRSALMRLGGIFLFVGAAVVFLGVPAKISRYCSSEISRWYSALALVRSDKGDQQGSERAVEAAIRWNPSDPQPHLIRAKRLLGQQKLNAALTESDEALKLNPKDADTIKLKIEILQRLGQHAQAIALADQLVQMAKKPQQTKGDAPSLRLDAALNLRAYTIARAAADGAATKEQLQLADDDIQQALASVGRIVPSDESSRARLMGTRAAYLDTLGYVQHFRGQNEAALGNVNRSLHTMELLLQTRADVVQQQALAEQLAPLFYHRGMILKALDRTEQGEADLRNAKLMGYDRQKGVW